MNTALNTDRAIDGHVYDRRRTIMDFVYELKDLGVALPRLCVRITENGRGKHSTIIETDRRGCDTIFIDEQDFQKDEDQLRSIVYHEILHAVEGIGHDPDCPLMRPCPDPLGLDEAQFHFRSYYEAS